MFRSILRGFMKLAVFSGRDRPSRFWPYAAVAVGIAFVGGGVIVIPIFFGAFARMQAFATAHPDQATVTATPGSYSIQIHGHHPELMPDFSAFFGGVGLTFAIAVGLLAAAVARRLHDAGRSGLWGLPPVLFVIVALVLFPRLFAGFDSSEGPDLGLFFLLFANNALYLGSLGLLVILLAGRSTPRPNRFGAPPEA